MKELLSRLKKWHKVSLLSLLFISLLLAITKPNKYHVLGYVHFHTPSKSKVYLSREKNYLFVGAYRVRVQEEGGFLSEGNSYTITYLCILGQVINISKYADQLD